MKKLSLFLVGVSLTLLTSTTFAAKTSLHHWICTTNASSSDVASDKAADKKLADTTTAASAAFALAAKNCRDCTEITCKSQK